MNETERSGLNLYRGSTEHLFEEIARLKAELAVAVKELALLRAQRRAAPEER
jgi:hypothetical protein